MLNFINWFFLTPTSIVAVLSFIVAFITYRYQRNWNRKRHTKEVTDWYSQIALPKIRYINSVLTSIGCIDTLKKFTKFEDFDSKELSDNFTNAAIKPETFKDMFNNITENVLDTAFKESGCNSYIYQCHISLKETISNSSSLSYSVFNKFIIDLLNQTESIALQLNCSVYDEKMIYPILHQTFLKTIKHLYYFIAAENTQDYDQFYIYTIWLYLLWDKRVKNEKQKIKRKFAHKSKVSKL